MTTSTPENSKRATKASAKRSNALPLKESSEHKKLYSPSASEPTGKSEGICNHIWMPQTHLTAIRRSASWQST